MRIREDDRDRQINRICRALRAAWGLNPEMRLGQLLMSAIRDTKQPMFYVGDEDLVASLDRTISKCKAIKRRRAPKRHDAGARPLPTFGTERAPLVIVFRNKAA